MNKIKNFDLFYAFKNHIKVILFLMIFMYNY